MAPLPRQRLRYLGAGPLRERPADIDVRRPGPVERRGQQLAPGQAQELPGVAGLEWADKRPFLALVVLSPEALQRQNQLLGGDAIQVDGELELTRQPATDPLVRELVGQHLQALTLEGRLQSLAGPCWEGAHQVDVDNIVLVQLLQ